jgi:hypothetical protein
LSRYRLLPTPAQQAVLRDHYGTGAFAGAHGYGRLQPTSTGSNVTLYLTG